MTVAEVRALLGAPMKVAPMEVPAGTSAGVAEVWTYQFRFLSGLRQVQTGETTYTRPNPLTGADETLSEPVFSTEEAVIEQTVEFLMYEGALASWKQSQDVDRFYH